MTNSPNITLAVNCKANGRLQNCALLPRLTLAETAFLSLSDALSEAESSQAFLASDASYDPAYSDPQATAAADMAAAVIAARAAGEAPVVLASDRLLVFAARFIACALMLENAMDRRAVLHFMSTANALWSAPNVTPSMRRARGLVTRAMTTMMRLDELLSSEAMTDPGDVSDDLTA